MSTVLSLLDCFSKPHTHSNAFCDAQARTELHQACCGGQAQASGERLNSCPELKVYPAAYSCPGSLVCSTDLRCRWCPAQCGSASSGCVSMRIMPLKNRRVSKMTSPGRVTDLALLSRPVRASPAVRSLQQEALVARHLQPAQQARFCCPVAREVHWESAADVVQLPANRVAGSCHSAECILAACKAPV